MQTFKNFTLPYLFLIFSMAGCIASLQTQSSPPDAQTATSEVVLSLATPKLVYTSKEAIYLELKIQNGKFDLLVPLANVATPSAFSQLKVTDTNGNIVKPRRPITQLPPEKIFINNEEKSIEYIQGSELNASAIAIVSLDDLQQYYQLQEGSYTVEVTVELPIYRDFLKKRHPEVIELEEEIKRIQKITDAHVSAADTRSAVNDLQQQIDILEKKYKDIYLPVESLLGKASLTSNSVTLMID